MTDPISVLHVDGDPGFLQTVAERLEAVDDRLHLTTATEAAAALEGLEGVDCLLTEAAPPGSERLQLVEHVSHAEPGLPVVVLDGELGDDAAVDALATGATEVMPRTTDRGALRVLANRIATVATPASDADGGGETMVETAPVGVWMLRRDTVTYANPACAELFGLDRSGLVGRSPREVIAPGDHDVVDAHVETLLVGERAERTDVVTGLGQWNEQRTLELQGRRTETPEGPAVLGTVRDVTAARRTERRLATLVGGLDLPVARVALEDGQAVARAVNPAFTGTFDVDREAVEGDAIARHVVPDDALEAALEAYVALERGREVDETVVRSTVDGERRFRLQGLPFEEASNPHAYLVYAGTDGGTGRDRDLGELQAVTRELIEADGGDAIARLGAAAAERVLDVEVACVYGVDDAGEALVPLAATEGAEALFGDVPPIPAGEGAAWYVHEMGDPLVTDDVREMETVLNRDTAVRSEMLLPLDGHGVFVASATEVGAFDEQDEALARTLASSLAAAFDRAETDRTLRERERELVRENERLEEFASVVSHDLRSPLAVILGNASLLREEGDVRYLDRIEAAGDRMEELLENLLSLARQGATVEEPQFLDAEEVVARAWATADTRDGTLQTDLDVALKADRSRLRQLLENLFTNAVDHGGPSVTVRVGTIEGDDRPGGQYGRDVEGFYVEDDGPGLPEDAGDLFEPGVSTDDDGTGFGLSIVKRIAEAHGWQVTATDGRAGGARFEFTGVDAG